MDKVVLLADSKSNAWGFAEKIKDYIGQEHSVNVPLDGILTKEFRNGEFKPYVPDNMRRKRVYFIQDSTKDPCRWWIELQLMKDLLLSSSTEEQTFVLPDLLWDRQDRKDKSHVPISARALANSLSFPHPISRVISMDLHAAQIQGFYDASLPYDNLYSFPAVISFLKDIKNIDLENLVVVSPDAGGVRRAKAFAKRAKSRYPIAFIYKDKDEDTGEILATTFVGDVKDKRAIIIDDKIDSGNTQIEAAELLKENGALELYAYGTHGLFTEGIEKFRKYFQFIATSNTHNRIFKEGISIVDVSPVFAEAIYRAHTGESISDLFK